MEMTIIFDCSDHCREFILVNKLNSNGNLDKQAKGVAFLQDLLGEQEWVSSAALGRWQSLDITTGQDVETQSGEWTQL